MICLVESEIKRTDVLKAVSAVESGAIVTFEGTVRTHNRGKRVTHLYYDAYSPMATREMERIRSEAMERWPLQALVIVHRFGRLEIGESSVLIAVSSAHRQDAFAACQFAINTLKKKVPIWKKEYYEDGEVWIEGYNE